MKYDYLIIYNDFFNKSISYMDFKNKLFNWFDNASIEQLHQFNDYIIDDQFTAYDADMVMLTYITVWLIPNRFNKNIEIQCADNMYMGFLKMVLDEYADDMKKECELISTNLNYNIYKRHNVYMILNLSDIDINIPLPSALTNSTHYCINCNDDIELEDYVELYPFGFYLIEK